VISRKLHNKLHSIIHAHDVCALKTYTQRGFSSKIPGSERLSYAMYGENGPLAYLLTQLDDEEKDELKNFTMDDLNSILYKDEGISLPFGIQQADIAKRNVTKKRRGRWGL